VKKFTQNMHCMFRCRFRQHLDIAGDRKAAVTPRLEASGKWSNMFKSSSPEPEGNTNTKAFTWLSAIKHDFAVR
jgi:hypothetical protein